MSYGEQVALAQTRISQSLRVFAPVVEGPQLQVTELGQALSGYVAEQQAALPHVRLRLHKESVDYHVPLPETDVALLFSNLVCNAVEAIGERGTIDIRLETRGQRVLISVEDSGPGFAEGDPQRFLQPFFSSKPRGTGLGLWMADRLARSVRGEVLLGNRPAGGARVSLVLPWLVARSLTGRRIEVADQDKVSRDLVQRHLESLGAQVTAVATGGELEEILARKQPDILITNLTLAEFDVPRMVRRLHPAVPVLVLSSEDQPHVRLDDPRPKKLAFLPKPFELQDLTLALCYLLWEAEQ